MGQVEGEACILAPLCCDGALTLFSWVLQDGKCMKKGRNNNILRITSNLVMCSKCSENDVLPYPVN